MIKYLLPEWFFRMSFNSADTQMEKHQSESKHFSLDQLIKKPWFVQMHYCDFKSNLYWKHESIDMFFFWSSMKESPQWNLSMVLVCWSVAKNFRENHSIETKRFGLFSIVKCVTKSSGEQLKVLTPYFLCLHAFKFQKFLSQ